VCQSAKRKSTHFSPFYEEDEGPPLKNRTLFGAMEKPPEIRPQVYQPNFYTEQF
jgi:hypothetical protein